MGQGAGVRGGFSTGQVDVPSSRTLTAGNGLVGGGDLSEDRTFDVVANGDGSLVVNPNDMKVGILATDAQHGARGGGSQHAEAVADGADGFLIGSDKAKLNALPLLESASPRLSIGDGSGAPILQLEKSAASEARFDWLSNLSVRWRQRMTVGGDFILQRLDSAGESLGNLVVFSNASGRATFEDDVYLGGDANIGGNSIVSGQMSAGSATATVSGNAVSLNFDNGNTIEFDMEPSTAAVAVTLVNIRDGSRCYATLLQGTGLDSVTFSAAGLTIKWDAGSQPDAIRFNNRFQIYRFHRVGSNLFADVEWQDLNT